RDHEGAGHRVDGPHPTRNDRRRAAELEDGPHLRDVDDVVAREESALGVLEPLSGQAEARDDRRTAAAHTGGARLAGRARVAIVARPPVGGRCADRRIARAGEARLDLAARVTAVAAHGVAVEALAPLARDGVRE